jgi:hypothetical protein
MRLFSPDLLQGELSPEDRPEPSLAMPDEFTVLGVLPIAPLQ